MKPIKQRNSEDIAPQLKKELKDAFEYELEYVIENLNQYNSIEEIIECFSNCLNNVNTKTVLEEYKQAKENESKQELKTGEEAYQQAIGL